MHKLVNMISMYLLVTTEITAPPPKKKILNKAESFTLRYDNVFCSILEQNLSVPFGSGCRYLHTLVEPILSKSICVSLTAKMLHLQ